MGRVAYKYSLQEELEVLEAQTNPITQRRPQQKQFTVIHNEKAPKGNKLNKILSTAMIVLTCITFTSYSFVSESEKKLNKLGKEIIYYTNENMDLQNQLDNLNSFRHVDSVIKANTALDTAKQIMEIPSAQMADTGKSVYIPQIHNWVIGY
ncbi:hypothetical protein IKQ26_01045 [bacterium]|nr:hypothetical protein [bacterium]